MEVSWEEGLQRVHWRIQHGAFGANAPPPTSLTFSSQQWSKVATELGEIKLYITQQVAISYCNFLLLTHLKQTSNQPQKNHRSDHLLGASKTIIVWLTQRHAR